MSQPSFIEELSGAVGGSWRLLIGRPEARQYFAEDPRGLVSSFLGLLGAVVITFTMSSFLAAGEQPFSSFPILVQNALYYCALAATSWIVLRFSGKPDRFIAYLVAENWTTAILQVLIAGLAIVSGSPQVVVIAAFVLGLAVRINNARIIVGLRPGQIALLIVVQTIGLMVALGVVGVLFGIDTAPQQI